MNLPLRQGASAQGEAKYAQEFIKLKQLEQKAREERGDSEVLGKGVLAAGLEASFAGTRRPSTIQGSDNVQMFGESIKNKAPHVHVSPPDEWVMLPSYMEYLHLRPCLTLEVLTSRQG